MNDNNDKIIAVVEEVAKEFIKSHGKYEKEIMDIVSNLKNIFNNLQELPEQLKNELGNKLLIAMGITVTFNNL